VRRAILLVLLIVCFGCRSADPPPTVSRIASDGSVSVSDVRFFSQNIKGLLWYRVIVPKVSPSEKLPVLYMLHGINSGPVEIMDRSAVANLASTHRLIVVMPEGGFSYYVNAKHRWRSRWEDAITRELMPDVEMRFPVLRGREHTGIAGISMGGYGAVSLALKHPELYAFAGAMSGPYDITRRRASLRRWGQTWRIWTIFGFRASARRDEDVFDLLKGSTGSREIRWFDSCGETDPLLVFNQRFAKQLHEQGAAVDVVETLGGHDWQSWDEAIPKLFASAERALR
jgi:putative tributyrin esterase